VRIKKVIGVSALVGGLGLGAAACGPVNVHWEKYPTGTSASLRTAEQHWWVNGGGDDFVYLNNDEATFIKDLENAESGGGGTASENKVLADAKAISRAAAAAARNPYPGNPTAYVSFVTDLQTAANDAVAGDIGDAITALENAETVQTNAGWATDFPAVPANLTN
jgi:hypothetical protein